MLVLSWNIQWGRGMDGDDLAQRVRRLELDGMTDASDHPPVLLELDC
jgi:hypothetical protein